MRARAKSLHGQKGGLVWVGMKTGLDVRERLLFGEKTIQTDREPKEGERRGWGLRERRGVEV